MLPRSRLSTCVVFLAAICLPASIHATSTPWLIRGQVVTPRGAVADAEVQLLRGLLQRSDSVPFVLHQNARTHKDGRFELAVDLAKIDGDSRARWQIEIQATQHARRLLELMPPANRLQPGAVELGGIVLTPGGEVHGQVKGLVEANEANRDDPLQRPIATVRVSLFLQSGSSMRPWRTHSGDDGNFSFHHIPPGAYVAVLDHEDYAQHTSTRFRIPDVAQPQPTDLGTVVLEAPLALRGQVVDARGKPLQGVRVRYRFLTTGSAYHWMAPRKVETNELGEFLVSRLPTTTRGSHLILEKAGFQQRFLQSDYELQFVRRNDVLSLTAPVELKQLLMLSGKVVDAAREPIVGATIQRVRGRGEQYGGVAQAMSDATGRFELAALANGPHRVRATARGFIDQEVELEAQPASRASDLTEIALQSLEATDLTVIVRDADGEPVSNASVSLTFRDDRTSIYESSSTDLSGQTHLDRLPVGHPYTVLVQHPEHPRWKRNDLAVEAGQKLIEVELDPAPWRFERVRGRVSSSHGVAIPGAEIRLSSSASGDSYTARSGAAGHFEIDRVKEGGYRLQVAARGYASTSQPLQVVPEVPPLEISLDTGVTLEGAIRGLTTEQMSQLRITARHHQQSDFREAMIADGGYKIQGLAPGGWSLAAEVGKTTISTELKIPPGRAPQRHDIEFPEMFDVRGQVLIDGTPVRSGLSLQSHEREAGYLSYSSATDTSGRFVFENVVGGAFDFWCFTEFGGFERQLLIESDAEVLIEAQTVRLRGQAVHRTSGAGLEGVEIRAMPEVSRSHGKLFETVTDDSGWFELGPLTSGPWTLIATRQGFLREQQQLEIGSGLPIRLQLTATAGLHYRVITTSGRLPEYLSLKLLDASGKEVATGFGSLEGGATGHWAQAPSGRFRLRVETQFTRYETDVEIPGPEVSIVLPAAGGLRLRLPEIEAEGSSRRLRFAVEARLELADDPNYDGPRSRQSRRLNLIGLTPGTWQIEVRAADGRSWHGRGHVYEGRSTEVLLQLIQ